MFQTIAWSLKLWSTNLKDLFRFFPPFFEAWKILTPFIVKRSHRILQKTCFCVSLKNESHTGLKWHEGAWRCQIFLFGWTIPLIIAHSRVASVERKWCRIRNFSKVIWAFFQWNNPNTFSSGRMRRLDRYESWRAGCASRLVCASL